ncbi:hypothetical protein [Deefgea sp. CFH1-16]|uniref:hypothetical protein n=1 Tax=Deefgea sp. CFH1-16 TaxID=2675457 RepID=UPI0015F38941|nr:hypothetical protein [Deefgea sp. CFH1-16]MBM5575320.1 hypothetical protein [Deefgea sp. CFH1-16]
MKTSIIFEDGQLIAQLTTGIKIEHADAIKLASTLYSMGIKAEDVTMPDWREGDIAPTSGQKIAILSHLRKLASS